MSISLKYAEPQRQARIAILIILLKFLRTTIRSAWPVALSFFIGGKSDKFETYVGIFIIGLSLINLVGSVLSYFRYFIQLEDDAIIIDKGILKRTKTNIPFERIQSINFKQNIVHQFFGVVSIEIDTAGASKSELTIDALDKEEAEKLRDHILSVKSQLVEDSTSGEVLPVVEELEEESILQLSVPDLIKVGVSQNHLRSMAILFGFALTIMNDLNENFDGMVEDELSGFAEFINESEWLLFLIFALAIAIISFIYSLVITLLGNYDLNLRLNKKGLKLVKGLLNREEISINKNKIQIVSWGDNPVRRIFKMWTITLEQASSDDAAKLKSKIKVPGSYQQQIDKVIESVFPKITEYAFSQHKSSRLLMFRLLIFVSIIPFLLSLVSFYWIEWEILWFLIWPILTVPYIYVYFKKRSFEISTEVFKNNKGVFGNQFEITQVHKIQAVQLTQSWYQRRKQLANVELFTAAGSLKVPFLQLDKALAIENYVLYRVETDKREWM